VAKTPASFEEAMHVCMIIRLLVLCLVPNTNDFEVNT